MNKQAPNCTSSQCKIHTSLSHRTVIEIGYRHLHYEVKHDNRKDIGSAEQRIPDQVNPSLRVTAGVNVPVAMIAARDTWAPGFHAMPKNTFMLVYRGFILIIFRISHVPEHRIDSIRFDSIWLDNFLFSMHCTGNSDNFPEGKRAAIVRRYPTFVLFFSPCVLCFYVSVIYIESAEHFDSEKLSQCYWVLRTGFEPLVFGSRVRCSTNWATPSPRHNYITLALASLTMSNVYGHQIVGPQVW